MRTFGAEIDAALAASHESLVLLVDAGGVLRALHARSFVDAAGDTWAADNGDFGTIEQTNDQVEPSLPLSLQNVDKFWLPHLATLNGTRTRILLGHRPTGKTGLLASLYVSGFTADRRYLRANLGDRFSALALRTLQPTVASLVEDGQGNEVAL